MCWDLAKVFQLYFGSLSHVSEILFSKQNCVVLRNDYFLFFLILYSANVFWHLGAFIITEMSEAKKKKNNKKNLITR